MNQGRLKRAQKLVGISVVGVALASLNYLPQAQAASSTSSATRAVAAQSVVDAFGVNAHIAKSSSSDAYGNISAVETALKNLGVKHIRTAITGASDQTASINRLAAAGIYTNANLGHADQSVSKTQSLVKDVVGGTLKGSVETVEGANEWNLQGYNANWVKQDRDHQKALYEAMKANADTSNIPVLAPSIGKRGCYPSGAAEASCDAYAKLGDLGAYSDFSNGHLYQSGQAPTNLLATMLPKVSAGASGKPVIFTETGYQNAMATVNTGQSPVTPDVAGVYEPRLLMDYYTAGVTRVYDYELVDEHPNTAGNNDEDHYGLLNYDFTPKPAYTSMQNMLTLLSDNASFTPGSLAYTVSNAPSDFKSKLVQKSDGSFYLIMWRNVSIYDAAAQTTKSVSPSSVTVDFGQSKNLSVYSPSTGAGAANVVTAQSISVPMAGELKILKVVAHSETTTSSTTTPVAHGLTGTYFAGTNFDRRVMQRVDPLINFGWGLASPDSRVPSDQFSVRWTGNVTALTTDNYTFTTTADDGVRLWVDGQLVIDNWTDHGFQWGESNATVALTAHQPVPIKLEYYDNAGHSAVHLAWSSSTQAPTIVPNARLTP